MLQRLSGAVLQPLARFPGFAGVLTGLFSFVPVLAGLVNHSRVKTYVLMALSVSLLVVWLICAALMLVKDRRVSFVLRAVILIAAIFWALPEAGTIATTGEVLNADSLALMSETTPDEALGFFAQFLTLHAVAILLLAAAIVAAFALIFILLARVRFRWFRMVAASIVAAMIAMGVYISGRNLKALTFDNYEDYLVWISYGGTSAFNDRYSSIHLGALPQKAVILFQGRRLINRNVGKWEERQRRAVAEVVPLPPDSLRFNVVMIVGESFIRAHSSLYGYGLPTNPRLRAEVDSGLMVVFDSVYTTANFTTPSLRNVFNLNRLDRGEEWYDGVYFPMAMKQRGWQCAHFDNQTVSRSFDSGIGALFYSPLNLDYTYEAVGDSVFAFDGDFLAHAHRILASIPASDRRFVTYHLMGQHFPLSDRYPGINRLSEAQVRSLHPALEPDELLRVFEYDNATVYNDSVVGAILDRWRGEPTVAIYFSDHGEDLPDLGDVSARNVQRPDDPAWVDRQFHIPFMVWTSPSFLERYPAQSRSIRDAASGPLLTDTLGYFILNLLEPLTIETPVDGKCNDNHYSNGNRP